MISDDLLEENIRLSDAEFLGKRKPLFWLLFKNALLTILTFGFYRFWGKTWVRQFYWGNTRVFGDSLEYTGRPVELLVGFLIVLAVLLPLGGIFGSLEFMAEGSPLIAQKALDIGYYVTLYTLIQIGFYRLWRFRLTRTTWRGIRFGMNGSAITYLGLAILWGMVTVISLGFAFPWMRAKLIEYRMNHSRFGNTNFTFHMPIQDLWGLFIPWLVTYLLYFGSIVALAFYYWPELQFIWNLATGTETPVILTEGMVKGYAAFIVLFLMFPFFLVWYRTRELQFTINGIRLAGHGFESHARPTFVLWRIILTLLFYVLIPAGLVAIFMALFYLSTLTGLIQPIITVAMIISAVLVLVVFPILTHLVFHLPVISHICDTLNGPDQSVFEEIIQSTNQDPSYGEGLADAFDVGAI